MTVGPARGEGRAGRGSVGSHPNRSWSQTEGSELAPSNQRARREQYSSRTHTMWPVCRMPRRGPFLQQQNSTHQLQSVLKMLERMEVGEEKKALWIEENWTWNGNSTFSFNQSSLQGIQLPWVNS